MTVFLYFDLATWSGWACGDVTKRPAFGSWRLPSAAKFGVGALALGFSDRFHEFMNSHRGVTNLGYEAPFIAPKIANLDAGRVIIGLSVLVDMFAMRLQMPEPIEVQPSSIKKYWTGHGRADKATMVREAKQRGYEVENDNEADAIAGWQLAITKEWPEITPEWALEGVGG